MLIQIDGWFAGGKGVLWSLLDSHPDIFVSPLHEYSYAMFLKNDFHPWIKSKNLLFFRNALAATAYYKFEQVYQYGTNDLSLSAKETLKLPYTIDFYQLDKKFISSLEDLASWSPENILETLYQTVDQLSNKTEMSTHKHFAFMGNAYRYKNYKNIPEVFPNMKNIIIKRDIRNIIASRTNRKNRPIDVKEYEAFAPDFQRLIETGEVNRISDYFVHMARLQKQYPDKFMIVEFENLINHTQESMLEVCKFLGIEFYDILTKPTRDGILLEQNGVSLIGSENDIYEKLLTPNEIATIDEKILHYNKQTHLLDTLNLEKNNTLFEHLRLLEIDLHNIALNYEKIVLYGDSHITDLASKILNDKVVVRISPDSLKNISVLNETEHDCILITNVGQENELIDKLKMSGHVELEKVIVCNI